MIMMLVVLIMMDDREMVGEYLRWMVGVGWTMWR